MVKLGWVIAYLDIHVLVDLEGVAEDLDVLHQRGELPHVPQLAERLDMLWRDFGFDGDVELCLVCGALVARHRERERQSLPQPVLLPSEE